MAVDRAYLDYNASAPLLGCARDAMIAALDFAANPSSVHREGRAARRIVENAREDLAALVGARGENVVFTSGATEAAATLLTPHWRMGRGDVRMSRLYVCAADHACILSGGRFAQSDIIVIGVDGDGLLKLDTLRDVLSAHDASDGLPLVAVHAANNETGVIQPLAAIAAIVKAAGGVLVVDAVQAAGRLAIDMSAGCGDVLILSGHKIGGPKGVGAIVSGSGVLMQRPLLAGGGQERGHRGGTENVAGIAGFGAAARHASHALSDMDAVRAKRDRAEALVLDAAPGAEIFGRRVHRLANTSFFSLPGLKAETVQIGLDLADIAVSAGSACSSGKVAPSHVLKAMDKASPEGAIRVSIGQETTNAEIDRFGAALAAIAARHEMRNQAA